MKVKGPKVTFKQICITEDINEEVEPHRKFECYNKTQCCQF